MAQYYGKTAVLSHRFGNTGVGNVAQHSMARLLSCLLGLGVQELVTWHITIQQDCHLVS